MPRLSTLLVLLVLAGCATRHEVPACSGDTFPLNPVGAPR